MRAFGINFESPIVDNAIEIGSAILVLFLSFALANNFKFLLETKKNQLNNFLNILSDSIGTRDSYTGEHVKRVAKYSVELAKALGKPKPFIDSLFLGALIHDLGKIHIPDAILNKTGKLTSEEWVVMKSHAGKGRGLLAELVEDPIVLDAIHFHHESMNGSGYPFGLDNEPLPACLKKLAFYKLLPAFYKFKRII